MMTYCNIYQLVFNLYHKGYEWTDNIVGAKVFYTVQGTDYTLKKEIRL